MQKESRLSSLGVYDFHAAEVTLHACIAHGSCAGAEQSVNRPHGLAFDEAHRCTGSRSAEGNACPRRSPVGSFTNFSAGILDDALDFICAFVKNSYGVL